MVSRPKNIATKKCTTTSLVTPQKGTTCEQWISTHARAHGWK